MTFDDMLSQVIDLLRREGRVSYRALKRRFALDDDDLEDVKDELIEAKRLAVDEGKVLVWVGATTAPPPAASPPLVHIPPHLTDKILAARPALEGERKQVTVLFADLKDSTELIRGLDPEAVQQLLDPAIHCMMDAVHRFEGTVNQVLGDGIMALYTQLRLDPLPPASAEAFLAALLGDDPSLAPLAPLFITRTEGNPFFLEESVRTLIEMEVMVGIPGTYRLLKPLQGMPVPATVQAVLAARIDRLAPEEKRLLQIAAVIGTDVPFVLLRAITDVPEAALHRGLAHLQAAEFLYETRLFPEQEYTFNHALTHEVAYGSLLLERRRVLHGCLVESLEALAPEQVDRLAHHALRGEVWDKAVIYCQQAGARAHDRAAPREAVASFEQALQALAHLPEPGDTRVLALDLRLALVRPLAELGEYGRRLALLREAEALARALDDRTRLVRALAGMTQVLMVTGDPDGAITVGQQALECAAALGDSALQVQASQSLGLAYYASGDFGQAVELLRWNVEATAREADTPSRDFRSGAWLARTLGALGAFAEGRRHGQEALRLATLAGRGDTPVVAHGCLGELYLAQGDLEHAIRMLDQGLALCRAALAAAIDLYRAMERWNAPQSILSSTAGQDQW